MPLDASLNKDVDNAAHCHIVYTSCLSEEDPRKFSMATPARGSHTYRRVWNCPIVPGIENGEMPLDGAPSSKRIIQDIDKFLTSAKTVFLHKGTVVNGLGTRHGHRNQVGATPIRGGARKKLADVESDVFIHPDAKSGRLTAVSNSVCIWQGGTDKASLLKMMEVMDKKVTEITTTKMMK
jgi:hypothetical protein